MKVVCIGVKVGARGHFCSPLWLCESRVFNPIWDFFVERVLIRNNVYLSRRTVKSVQMRKTGILKEKVSVCGPDFNFNFKPNPRN